MRDHDTYRGSRRNLCLRIATKTVWGEAYRYARGVKTKTAPKQQPKPQIAEVVKPTMTEKVVEKLRRI